MDNKYYLKLLNERHIWYKTIKQYYCPLLKQNIIFNAKGFHHIFFDGRGQPRNQQDRINRLLVLPLTLAVLKTATKIHEHSFDNTTEYWLLKEIVGKQNVLVMVILRKIGNGNIMFHSVWKK